MLFTKDKNNLTKEGKELFNNEFSNKNIIDVHEYYENDGYDKHGPKSYLWYIDIITLENGKYYKYSYGWEKWFSTNDTNKYELLEKIDITKDIE